MSMFGAGQVSAQALRGRIVERLGAEPEWISGDPGSRVMHWKSGSATTSFYADPASEGTPDLGVLWVMTAVAQVGDKDAALGEANELNLSVAANRWTVSVGAHGEHVLSVSCRFVVGPHNMDALEGFVDWCVREQIAMATLELANGIAGRVAGTPVTVADFAGGTDRADWHEATGHFGRVASLDGDQAVERLAGELRAAFARLRQEMLEQGTGVWHGSVDDGPLECWMPLSWEGRPDGVIGPFEPGNEAPAALVRAEADDGHPLYRGKGLSVTMRLPLTPGESALPTVSAMNLFDRWVHGATHRVGAWALAPSEDGPPLFVYNVYLPATLAEPGIDLPTVMREVLLTLARQALLSRRMLSPEALSPEDQGTDLGLAISEDSGVSPEHGPHGLAWGETGEGRNPAASILDWLHANYVAADAGWALARPGGFTWWPHQQAQDISAMLLHPEDPWRGATVRMATQVRRDVPVTDDSLVAIARLNAELSASALVLNETGSLDLVSRLFVHGSAGHLWGPAAELMAIGQAVTAREPLSRVDGLPGLREQGLGEPALSGHPFAGPRPEASEGLQARRELFGSAVAKAQDGLTTRVALLALAGLEMLPHKLSLRGDGGLDVIWHPSQGRRDVLADPAVRTEIWPGDPGPGAGFGPGWLLRSHVPVAGDEAARARWCNDRNAELLGAGEVLDRRGTLGLRDLTVPGGWGFPATGECSLTWWLSPFASPDEESQATALSNLLRDQQGAVVSALIADPGAVADSPLTPGELAEGLASVLATAARVLEYPADYQWAAAAGEPGVVVTLTGSSAEPLPLTGDESATVCAPGANNPTALHIPAAANRAELSLLYASSLGRSLTRIPAPGPDGLIPGEANRWTFTPAQLGTMAALLEEEGLIQWSEEHGWVFDAGTASDGPVRAMFQAVNLTQGRPYGSAPLVIRGVLPADVSLRDDGGAADDPDLIGFWGRMTEWNVYHVVIPPAGLVWGTDYEAVQMLTWVGRHVIRHVQSRANPARPTQSD